MTALTELSQFLFCFQMTIVNFMNTRFDRIVDTQQALRLLRKFETLNLPNLGIQDKYHRILSHYARDIDGVSRTYQKNKTDPPIARDLPPIAGNYKAISGTKLAGHSVW